MTAPVTVYHAVGGKLVRARRPGSVVEPPPPPPPATLVRFPGDPNPKRTGRTYWGEGHGANGPVTSHETATGVKVGIHRSFFNDMADIAPPNGALLAQVRNDHANNRLPLVSLKAPSWQTAMNGGYDAAWDALIAALESYPKPSWLILDHEPEDNYKAIYGDKATQAQIDSWTATYASRYRAMQVRFRQRLDAYAAAHGGSLKRISFGGCLMTWTFNPLSRRNPEDWWPGAGVWDWVGNDHYTESKEAIERRVPWGNFMDFLTAHGNIPFCLPEWALRRSDTNGPAKMQTFFDRMTSGAFDCVGLCFFDSNANSRPDPAEPGSIGWAMVSPLLDKYHAIMRDRRAVHMSDLGY